MQTSPIDPVEVTEVAEAVPAQPLYTVKKSSKFKRFRPTPPGPRLVRATALATALMAVQSFFIPLGPFHNQKAGASSLVPLAAPFKLSYELSDLRRQI